MHAEEASLPLGIWCKADGSLPGFALANALNPGAMFMSCESQVADIEGGTYIYRFPVSS